MLRVFILFACDALYAPPCDYHLMGKVFQETQGLITPRHGAISEFRWIFNPFADDGVGYNNKKERKRS